MADNLTINANTPAQATMRATNTAGVYWAHSYAELWVANANVTNTNQIPVMVTQPNGALIVAGTNAFAVVENFSGNIALNTVNNSIQIAAVGTLVTNTNVQVANVAALVTNTSVQVANVASIVTKGLKNTSTVAVATDVSSLFAGANTLLTPTYTLINNITANTDVVTAQAGKKITVHSMTFSVTGGLMNVVVQSNTTPSGNLSIYYLANTGVPLVLPFNPVGWFRNVNANESNQNMCEQREYAWRLYHVDGKLIKFFKR